MKKSRLISLILCAALLASSFASCSEKPADETEPANNSAVNSASETTPDAGDAGADENSNDLIKVEADYDWKAGVAAKDYGGIDYTILNGCTASWYSYTIIVPEETTGEPVNDAFVTRNQRTEEFLNIKIIENNDGDSLNILKNAVKAGTQDFDVGLVTLMSSYEVAMANNLFDLNTLNNADFSQTWWDQNAVNDLTINNKLYFITGDADTTRFDGIRSLYFNKEMVEQNGLENPYDLVDNNKWTMDKFTEMCCSVIVDKDGDGAMTDKDQYGYIGYSELMADLLLVGMGERYLDIDPDNGHIIDGTTSEKLVDVYGKIYNLLYTQTDAAFDVRGARHKVHDRGLGDRAQETIFTENGALFYSECMAWTRVLRDMEADFGVLPPPKYNEEQSRYYSVIINPFMQMIPVTSADPERTLHVMNVLAAASHDTVVEAYVNVTLTGKVARDQNTVRMLHLVFDELAYNLHFSSVSVRSTVNNGLVNGNENITSILKKMEKVTKKQLDKTNTFFFGE